MSLFTLARRMGTSVDMIDRTYGHLAPDAEDYERGLLDAFDTKTEAFGHLSGIDRRLGDAAAREIPANAGKPTPGLEPGTPSLRVKCSTS